MAQVVESGSIQLDTNSNIVPAGSFQLDGAKPMFEETPFKGQHPNIYAGLKTAADMVPYMKYVDPEERERFNQLATNQQTRELLIENLYTVVGMGLPTIGKSVAAVVSPLAERLLPKTFKMLTKERTFGKVAQPEVAPVPEASPVVEPKPVAKPKVVKAKSIELDKPEVKVEPKIEPVVEPKVIPAESIKLDEVAPEVKVEAKPIAEQSITAEDFELHPDRMENLKKGFVAFQVDGKTISAKIGSKVNGQEVFNHADLGMAKGLDFDTAVPGFLDKKGSFVEQYPTVKTVADRPSGETVGVSSEKTLPARPAVSNIPTAETVTPPVKPTVAETKTVNEVKRIEPKRGDRFTDDSGKEWEVWKSRSGQVEAHPIINGKPVVNRETTQRWAVTTESKLANPEARTDYNAKAVETKVIPTTKKAEANVVSPKEQKTYVLDKVDGLITEARKQWREENGTPKEITDQAIDEKVGKRHFRTNIPPTDAKTVVIDVPNDGKYTIPNHLEALINFQKKFKSLKTSTETPDLKSSMPSKKPTGKSIGEIEKEAWEEYRSDYEAYKRLSEDETLPSESRDYYQRLAKIREPAVQEWIKTSGTDIPKEPKDVQLNSGLDPTQIIDIMKTISAKTSEIIEANKMTPSVARGVKAGKDAMIEHHRNLRRAESTSKLFEKTVNDIVPDPKRQMMMVHAYENKMKGKYWSDLTEIEKGVVRWIAQEKAKISQYIKSNKILETMPENENINHIYHHWINKETGEPYQAMYGRFSKGLPQAKQRVIPTYEKGIENGMTPATTNIGKLVGLELESVTRANNARQLFKTLHGIKGDESMSIILSKGGKPKPIRMVESWSNLEKQGLTDGYIRYDNSYLDTAMTFESADGRLVTMKGAVGVKEELHPFVRSYLESPTYGKLSELNFAAKSLKLGASLFHVVSLGMQELANMRIPFVHIPKGLRLIKELSPETRLLHQEGLELFKGYEDLGFQDKFFDNATQLGKVGNAITIPISMMRDFIFKYVQPGMKASFADMQFRKLLPQYLKDTGITAEEVMKLYEQGKPLPPEALRCAREVVQKADGHFSGEDFKRSMLETNRFMVKAYFTPEARKAWQVALLSPTWQREHLIVAKNVAKSFMPDKAITKLGMAPLGPIKSQYRKYALGAIMMVGSVDMWNYMSTQVMDGEGKHLWENPTGKGFAVRAWWDEPAYTMKTKNGQDRYIPSAPAYIRPLKSVFEVAEWVHDPVLKASYKFSPVVAAIGEQLFGQKRYVGLPDIPERAKDFIIDSATPIVVDQWVRTAQGKQSAYATAMPFFGMPVSRLRERDNTYKIKYKDSSAQ